MGIKNFLLKQTLKWKGVPADQIDSIADKIESNPEMMEAMKKLGDNKEVVLLMETIQKEIEEKTKGGMDQMMATMNVMMKHKAEFAKHRDVLEPLLGLMQK